MSAKVLSVFIVVLVLICSSFQTFAAQDPSSDCTVEPSCVVPDPLAAPREGDLRNVVREMQCEVGCIEQHEVILPKTNENTSWPSLVFDALKNNCRLYQKVYECKEGCMTRFVNPSITINRCRDKCFNDCERQTCTGSHTTCENKDNTPCGRQCRKTYCRFGCILYDSLSNFNKTNQPPSPPTAAPNVTAYLSPGDNPSSHRWLFSVDPTIASPELPVSGQNGGETDLPNVGFILKIAPPQREHISYQWQKNLSTPIDLSAFPCRKVSLSFAVVSKFTSMEEQTSLTFSPETTVCVPGLGGRPSQVNRGSIRVSYTEDLREGYRGYSVANISWNKPEGFQYVSSYNLNIYPDRDSCGGESVMYTYSYINKDYTSFIVLARNPTGLLKFGCSYLYELVTLPSSRLLIGPSVTSIPTLSGPAPQIDVLCSQDWNKTSGNFNISLSWNIHPNTTQTSHIKSFTLTPMLLSDGATTARYSPHMFTPENDMNQYSIILPDYQPQTTQKYMVEITSSKDSTYFWRANPGVGSCTVSADPHSPDKPINVSISELGFNNTRREVRFNLKWLRSTASYGSIERYEVLVTEESEIDNRDISNGQIQTFSADTTVAMVSASLGANETTHCAFVKMRAVNSYFLVSDWTETLVIPLDDQCVIDIADKISLFYEKSGSETVQLLELNCHSDLALFGGKKQSSVLEAIKRMEQRMENLNNQLVLEQQEKQRLVTIEDDLSRVEGKLDALMELMARHEVRNS